MSLIVSDTSPIRALAHLGLIELLRELFVDVLVPPAVAAELSHPPIGLTSVDVNEIAFMRVQAPRDEERVAELRRSLDPGESEALALELGIAAILTEEEAGRAMARKLGLLPLGVLGTLVRAKQAA